MAARSRAAGSPQPPPPACSWRITVSLRISSVSGKLYRQFLEILDDRHGQGATLITSQFPVAQWHEMIADETVADAILDRLVHNAYRIELQDGKKTNVWAPVDIDAYIRRPVTA